MRGLPLFLPEDPTKVLQVRERAHVYLEEQVIEWFFAISLSMPGLCDTAACEARGGEVRNETIGVDKAHCERLRKVILGRIRDEVGVARDGRLNLDGTVSECEERERR